MELICKHFTQLTRDELFQIYKLRVAVFIVEQQCAYPEIDDADQVAWHLWLQDGDGIAAYLRVLPPGATFDTASLGRVIAVKRRQGLGSRIVAAGIRAAQEQFGAQTITIEAQTYARALYQRAGFVQTSEEFLEDGIPHIRMEWRAGH